MIAKLFLRSLYRDRRGATTIEYGLILVMVVIAIISALRGVADQNTGMWALVSSRSQEAHNLSH